MLRILAQCEAMPLAMAVPYRDERRATISSSGIEKPTGGLAGGSCRGQSPTEAGGVSPRGVQMGARHSGGRMPKA